VVNPVERRIALIFNPEAGTGRFRVSGEELKEEILRSGKESAGGIEVDLFSTGCPGDCEELSKRAVREGYDTVVASGGDGTILEAANSLAGSDTALGVLPIGSGNDTLCSIAGHASRDICIQDIVRGKTRTMDLGVLNGRYFVNVVGLGLDAAVNHDVARRREMVKRIGPTGMYILGAVRMILRYRGTAVELILDGGGTLRREAYMITVGNGTTCGGGFRLTPRARMDDGLLDVSVIRPANPLKALSQLRRAYKGTHIGRKEVTYWQVKGLSIRSLEGEVPYHMDGEGGMGSIFDIGVAPRAIKTVHPDRWPIDRKPVHIGTRPAHHPPTSNPSISD